MIFKYDGVRLHATLRMNDAEIDVVLDTGATYSTFCKPDVRFLCDDINVSKLDDTPPIGSKIIRTASNEKLYARPCVLSNVTIDNVKYRAFPCYVRTDNIQGVNLIGLDFILLCRGVSIDNSGITFSTVPTSAELVVRMFTGTKSKKALVLNLAQSQELTCEELSALLIMDSSLSPDIEKFKIKYNITDAELSQLLLTASRYYDIHSVQKFNRLLCDLNILEVVYDESKVFNT